MARSWEYASWKRTALAVVMVLVLGVSLGLAELVVRHERAVHPPAGPTRIGSITFYLPSPRWVITKPMATETIALEPSGERRGRVLRIQQLNVNPDVTPEEFVDKIRLTYPHYTDWNPGDNISGADQIRIAGFHGVLIAMEDIQPEIATGDHQTVWVAAAMLAPGRMLAIQLVCPDETHPLEDKEAIEGIISGLTTHP
jgi:hypothetical protein